MRWMSMTVLVGVVLMATACETAQADVCGSLTELQTSVQALVDLEPAQVGLDGVQAALDVVADDLDAVLEAGRAELGDDVEALQSSLQGLRDVVQDAETEGVVAAADLEVRLQEVATSWDALVAAADSLGCDLQA